MRLKRDLLGIILAFMTTGAVATSADTNAYQELYQQHDRQEAKIDGLIDSEFVSTNEQKQLAQALKTVQAAEKTETRRSLKSKLANQQKLLSKVKKSAAEKEEQTAKKEYAALSKEVAALDKKRQENYILAEDAEDVTTLKNKLQEVAYSEKVQPIRELENAVVNEKIELEEHQTKLISLVDELKQINETSTELANKNRLRDQDKESLSKDRGENSRFFEDADDLELVESRKATSKSLIEQLQAKQERTEKDFAEYEGKANELITSIQSLLAAGELTQAEKDTLQSGAQVLSNTLEMQDYKPGDLQSDYQRLQSSYNQYLENSAQRAAEAQKKAQQEAAEQAAREAAAAKQAAERAQANAASSNPAAGSSQVGGWHQAPAGHKYLKESSGLTYGQVKMPENFRLITIEEAAQYRPGHGNGSAKQ